MDVVDRKAMEKLLGRSLKSDRLHRLPKSYKEQKILVALAASVLDPRETYSEQALNDVLAEWMQGFVNDRLLDHVTIRRYMVDLGYVLRDAKGSFYRANQAVINPVISPEARMVQPAEIYEAQRAERAARSRAHSMTRAD